VIDGYWRGAKVFVDRNENGSYDDGEPYATSGGGGRYTMSVSSSDIGSYPMIALGDPDTIDESTGAKLGANVTLYSPKENQGIITPITTMVYTQIKEGSTYEDAKVKIMASMGIENENHLFTDYISAGLTTIASKAEDIVKLLKENSNNPNTVLTKVENGYFPDYKRYFSFQNNCGFDVWVNLVSGSAGNPACSNVGKTGADAPCPDGWTCTSMSDGSNKCVPPNASDCPTGQKDGSGLCTCDQSHPCPSGQYCNVSASPSTCFYGLEPPGGSWEVNASKSKVLMLPYDINNTIVLSGNMVARTGCDDFGLNCQSADCGSPSCFEGSKNTPQSTVEFTLGKGNDWYDVSYINGVNIPIMLAPVKTDELNASDTTYRCGAAGAPTGSDKLTDGLKDYACTYDYNSTFSSSNIGFNFVSEPSVAGIIKLELNQTVVSAPSQDINISGTATLQNSYGVKDLTLSLKSDNSVLYITPSTCSALSSTNNSCDFNVTVPSGTTNIATNIRAYTIDGRYKDANESVAALSVAGANPGVLKLHIDDSMLSAGENTNGTLYLENSSGVGNFSLTLATSSNTILTIDNASSKNCTLSSDTNCTFALNALQIGSASVQTTTSTATYNYVIQEPIVIGGNLNIDTNISNAIVASGGTTSGVVKLIGDGVSTMSSVPITVGTNCAASDISFSPSSFTLSSSTPSQTVTITPSKSGNCLMQTAVGGTTPGLAVGIAQAFDAVSTTEGGSYGEALKLTLSGNNGTLSLQGTSSGTRTVNLASSNTSVATLSRSDCSLGTSQTSCTFTVTPSSSNYGLTSISASSDSLKSVKSPYGNFETVTCTSHTDCSNGETCGLAYSTVEGNGTQTTCGTRLGYWSYTQFCTANKGYLNNDLGVKCNDSNIYPFATCSTTTDGLRSCYNTSTTSSGTDCCGCEDWMSGANYIPTPSGFANNGKCISKDASYWVDNVLPKVKFIKEGCFSAYSYQYDDPTSTFTCSTKDINSSNPNKTNYQVTFCPKGVNNAVFDAAIKPTKKTKSCYSWNDGFTDVNSSLAFQSPNYSGTFSAVITDTATSQTYTLSNNSLQVVPVGSYKVEATYDGSDTRRCYVGVSDDCPYLYENNMSVDSCQGWSAGSSAKFYNTLISIPNK